MQEAEETRNELIREGKRLFAIFLKDVDMGLSFSFLDDPYKESSYMAWLKKAKDFLRSNGLDSFELFGGSHERQWVERPPAFNFMQQTVSSSGDSNTSKFITKFEKQIDFLRQIKFQTSIRVSRDGLIINESNNRAYQYQPQSKRFKLIVYLSESKRSVSTKILLEKLHYTGLTLLSKEKRAVNATMLEKLGIAEFIPFQEYRINPLYEVVLE